MQSQKQTTFLLLIALIAVGTALFSAVAFAQPGCEIQLLEPIGTEVRTINVCDTEGYGGWGPISGIFEYFNSIWMWALGVAAGMTVAWILWAGTGMVMAGGDQSKYSAAVGQMKGVIIGLLLLIFMGLILQAINASFFSAT